jgi:hypothetical protein
LKAVQLEQTLKGRSIGSWEILDVKNFGKSAAVFRVSDGTTHAALKVLDDELVEKYDDNSNARKC